MAVFLNVLVNTSKPLSTIVSEINELLETHLVIRHSEVGDVFTANLSDGEITVVDNHGLEADREMDFPAYQILIDIGPLSNNVARDDRLQQRALLLAKQLSQQKGYSTMVTRDLQRVVERYESEAFCR